MNSCHKTYSATFQSGHTLCKEIGHEGVGLRRSAGLPLGLG
jgi:hypothetical protein